MKIIFAGSSGLAVPCLKALMEADGHTMLGVITQPDRPKGRGLKESQTAVKQAALKYPGLAGRIFQPESINAPDFIDTLKKLGPDITVVVAYGQKLSGRALESAPHGCINMHPSLLPRYRGAAPVNHAIRNGDKTTGVTIFRLVEKMDAGPIINRIKTDIEDSETAVELAQRLSDLGAKALIKAIGAIADGRAVYQAQNDEEASLAPKLKKSDGVINWAGPARSIFNQFRAMKPWPGTHTNWNNLKIEIDGMRLISDDATGGRPGQLAGAENDFIAVQAQPGLVGITRLKPAGRRELNVREFVNGYRIKIGDILG
ncbi:MAG: methionyl-tRNA formyltransferase [Planctomycetota bacterium]